MDTTIKQLPLRTNADILFVHNIALQLAEKGGLSILEQASFACKVTQLCAQIRDMDSDEEIVFSLDKTGNDLFLKAVTKNQQDNIRIRVPRYIDNNDISFVNSFSGTVTKQQEESYLDMQQFTLALSHELKNSITKIKLSVSLVELEEMSPVVKKYVEMIHRASGHLERTMLSLDEIIRFRHSNGTIKKINPTTIFDDVREEFADALENAQATIDVDLSGIPEMNYIEIYLRTVFSNIISNAVKYSLPGRSLHISVNGRREKGFCVFSLVDNGRGMDLERIGKKLFEPFSRFSENIQGSGLGLFIIKKMVERNGGKVEVESKPGLGTAFHFYLKEY